MAPKSHIRCITFQNINTKSGLYNLIPILNFPLHTTNSISTLRKNSFLPIRQDYFRIAPYTNRHNIPNPSRNEEAAHCPNPNYDP
jgi:hypothetical protein